MKYKQSQQQQNEFDLGKALWSFLGEMRTGVVLLVLLAVASIPGSVLIQNASPEEYIARYGVSHYNIIKHLGLDNVYDTPYYKILLALVGLNLIVCSINRLGITWRRTFFPKVSTSAQGISTMPRSEIFNYSGSISQVTDAITATIRSRSYHVFEKHESDGVISLFAAKGRVGLWGPYLTHVSLLVIFLGAIIGNTLGFAGFTGVNEGESTTVCGVYEREGKPPQEMNLGFRLALKKFRIGHDATHNPTSYTSDVAIYEGDNLIAQKTIDVNHPLTYRGISFFQTSYGIKNLIIKLTAQNGDVVRVPFDMQSGEGPHSEVYAVPSEESIKSVYVGAKHLTVYVDDFQADYDGKTGVGMSFLPIHPAVHVMINDKSPKSLDAWSQIGWLEEGKSVSADGYNVQLEDVVYYSSLQVSSDPGLPIVYFGFGLMMLGVILSFYIPYRVIRIRVSVTENGMDVAVGASSKESMSVFDTDFRRIRKAIQ